MTAQIEGSLAAGAARVVVGALQADGTWDTPLLRRWVDAYGAHRIVIHRAFDACTDWEGAAPPKVAQTLDKRYEPAWDGRDGIRQLVDGGFDDGGRRGAEQLED